MQIMNKINLCNTKFYLHYSETQVKDGAVYEGETLSYGKSMHRHYMHWAKVGRSDVFGYGML